MTHNHGSNTGNTAPFPFLDNTAIAGSDNNPCKAEREKVNQKCSKDGKALKKGENWTTKHCNEPELQIRPQSINEKDKDGNLLSDKSVLKKSSEVSKN